MRGWVVVLLVACGAPPAAPATSTEGGEEERPAVLFSEPAEYIPQPPSAELGRAHFTEYGVGDPYGAGIAYPIFRGLMAEMPEELGATFAEVSARFGFVPGEGEDDLPYGFHLTRDPNTGVDFLVSNCQVCHAGRVRTAEGERVVEGLGNRQVRIHAYGNAFARIAADERFRAGWVADAAAREAERMDLRWPPDYRAPLVGATVRGMKERFLPRADALARLAEEGLPGKVATLEGFSLAFAMQTGEDIPFGDVIGWTRVPDVVVAPWRETNSFDGIAIGSPVAMAVGADFAFGVRPQWFEEHRHIGTSVHLYLRSFTRSLPFPGEVDEAQATEGYAAFEARCAGCHGHYARPGESPRVAYREKVVPASVVGTDRARLDAITDAFLQATNDFPETRGLTHARRTNGWVPRPLVQVWARGQYGHAGQWPDLRVLATPPDERPVHYVVSPGAPLDLERIGQVWRPADEGPPGEGEYLYDGTRPGYGVQGHPFLADAPEPEREAILAYLRTL